MSGVANTAEGRDETVLAEGRRVARNSVLLGIGNVTTLLLGFATTVLVTDRLSSEYGVLLSAQRFVGLFLVLAQFGLQPLVVRAVAARHQDAGAWLGTVIALRVGLGIAFFALVTGVALGASYLPGELWLLQTIAAIELVGIFTEVHVGVCEGLERMGASALIAMVRSVAMFVSLLVVLALGFGLRGIVATFAIGRGLQLLAAVVLTRRVAAPLRLEVRRDWLGSALRDAVLFVAIGFAFQGMSSLDAVLLSRLAGTEQVSWYGGALNFFEVLLAVPLFVQRSLLPALTRLGVGAHGAAMARASLQVFGAVLLPASVGLSLLAPDAVALYQSGSFAASAPVLRILALCVFFAGISVAAAVYLTGVGRLPAILASYAFALPVEVALCAVLAPSYGARGVAVGRLAAQVVFAAALMVELRRAGVSLPWAGYARQGMAAAAMAAVVVGGAALPWWLRAALGGTVYAAALLALAGRDGLEALLLRELLEGARGLVGRLRGGPPGPA